ncbi:MAG: hypothetical protein HS117_22740 [Verrucomicrobiaceae bacterium]|nr:hypothetical protein [Verrucomicrobiaceae bacterium]
MSEAEQQTNHRINRMRVVEHIFARIAQMGGDLCRSIGLKRATQHNHLSNLVYNMDRYASVDRITPAEPNKETRQTPSRPNKPLKPTILQNRARLSRSGQ